MNVHRVWPAIICVALFYCSSTFAQRKTGNGLVGQVIEIPPPGPSKAAPKSIQFGRINLGGNINSQFSDLFPVLTPDESIMYFVRKGDPQNAGFAKNPNDEDIWYSVRRSDGGWDTARRLQGPLNTINYDGVRAINSVATHLYLQNIYNSDGTGSKGFSISEKQPDGTWSFPEPLDIDDYYNDTSIAMMTVSSDEQTIIFSLKRKDSKGGHDFYLSHHIQGHKWARPELIEELSTPGDEIAPFIAFDDHTLYFSTNGRGGLGGYDIFIARRLDSTWMHWSAPRNLGAPINTPSFDAYFMLGARGDTAYFSSSDGTLEHGYGKSDIWKIGLKEDQRPGFNMPSGSIWDANVTEKDLKGSVFRLDNVLFDVGKSTLSASSKPALNQVADVMKRLPGLRLEVQGHTDADGDPNKNILLSQLRAQSVCDYLISRGVAVDRLTAKGYGPVRPIAPNDTPQGKALNRRVMIEVKN
ncbi:MAG TPA: OmpA family protein [Candidatus Kapabacteria bacterium]|jgi:outer membrane protein OmpA-like peptidoglycan-associated protein|nr:OmpA family protein [Candidatus Kapabacteria bacterium]